MARPKRINPKTGLEFRSDRELVYEFQNEIKKVERAHKQENKTKAHVKAMAAATELWDKYFELRMKMFHELRTLCNRNGYELITEKDDYNAEAWIKFINQMDGVRLEDVEHLPNWSIYIRLWGYWRSMNRDMIKHWLDWRTHTIPIYSISEDKDTNSSLTNIDIETAKDYHSVESKIEVDINKEIFWESIDQLKFELSPKQKQLLNMKVGGKKKSDIMNTLQINGKILNDSLTFIKKRLGDIVISTAKKKGIDLTYEDMLSSFGGV